MKFIGLVIPNENELGLVTPNENQIGLKRIVCQTNVKNTYTEFRVIKLYL